MYNIRNIMQKTVLIFVMYVVRSLVIADIHSDMFSDEVRSLSQLPMEKLIHIKSAFFGEQALESRELEANFEQSSPKLPIALPLRRPDSIPARRHDDYWPEEKSKSSKISKIFQLAITALSFLAFGGYLLTLIITALRSNATATPGANVIFLQGLQSLKRPKRAALFYDPMENDFHTDRLYRGMIMLSEGYALYN